jgi:hypothetical protein
MRHWIRKLLPDPERSQKLLEIFLRIYETFQNSGNNFTTPNEVSGSGNLGKYVLLG